jgi:carbon monoxide dehydrogenase subunit G
MNDMSYFESRPGKLTCTAEEVFNFVTDIRNFKRFIPQGTINNWQSERESCSFSVSMLGTVNIRLSEKEMYKKVVFAGNALKNNDFSLVLNISDNGNKPAEVKVSLKADLNPMMKMMATKPIGQFLEMLINEMKSFKDWEDTRV